MAAPTLLSGRSVLKRNLDALRKHRPALYEIARQEPRNPAYRLMPTTAGWPNLVRLGIPDPIPYYDLEQPQKALAEDLKPEAFHGARLAVLLGCGLGLEVEQFVQGVAPATRTQRLLVIEADPDVFRLAVRTTLLEKSLANPAIEFLVGVPPADLYAKLFSLFTTGEYTYILKTMAMGHTRGALLFHRDYYLKAAKIVREAAVEAVTSFGNAPHDSLIGLQNMLLNLPIILHNPGIQDLKGAFVGKPAIVIATGPSLNDHVALLRELQDKAVLVAADASLAPLLKNGIRPHIITSLERVPKVAELFQGISATETYLAACPVLDPSAYAAYNGPHIVTYRNFDHFTWIGVERGQLHIGPSSGNMAFKIAEFMGCDPIILVGQDLAFASDGRSHASGAVLGEQQVTAQKEPTYEVPGNAGQPVLTTRTWLRFLKFYEYDLARYTGTCINVSRGGAFISGTQLMSLEEAAARYLKEPLAVTDKIRARLQVPDRAQVKREAEKVLGIIRQTAAAMDRIQAQCVAGYELATQIAQRFDPSVLAGKPVDMDWLLSQTELAELNKRQNETLSIEEEMFQLFMQHTAQSYMIHWRMEFYAAAKACATAPELAQRLLEAFAEWFQTIYGLIQISKELLQQGEAVALQELQGPAANPAASA